MCSLPSTPTFQIYKNTLETLSRKLRLVKNLSGVLTEDPDILPFSIAQTPDSPILQSDIVVAKQVRLTAPNFACTRIAVPFSTAISYVKISIIIIIFLTELQKATQHLNQINEISEITMHACEVGRCYSHFIGLLGKSIANVDGAIVTSDVVGSGVKSISERLMEYERLHNEMVSNIHPIPTF